MRIPATKKQSNRKEQRFSNGAHQKIDCKTLFWVSKIFGMTFKFLIKIRFFYVKITVHCWFATPMNGFFVESRWTFVFFWCVCVILVGACRKIVDEINGCPLHSIECKHCLKLARIKISTHETEKCAPQLHLQHTA